MNFIFQINSYFHHTHLQIDFLMYLGSFSFTDQTIMAEERDMKMPLLENKKSGSYDG